MYRFPKVDYLEFKEVIGVGGMSVVWKAWHTERKEFVAVKVLNDESSKSGGDIRQFMQESRAMMGLNHPGIVRAYDADCIDGQYFYVMELMDGYTFNDYIIKKHILPEGDVLIITQTIADALAYAWNSSKILHCDIKPDNIMVNMSGEVKLSDFGLCELSFLDSAVLPGSEDQITGTPEYMSPEQIIGTEKLDCRTDIYSLGASLYHLLTRRTLFDLPTPEEIIQSHIDPLKQAEDPRLYNSSLSSGIVALMERMLAKERDERYSSWEEVMIDAKTVEESGKLPRPDKNIVSSIRVLF